MRDQYKLIVRKEHLKDILPGLRKMKDKSTLNHLLQQVKMQNRRYEL